MSKIKETLLRLFQDNRIVFWYDDQAEMKDEYNALEFKDITKIEIENNEFGLKYRVLREEPEQKFLIYSSQEQPPVEENWLIDLNLAYHVFCADQPSLILEELGLGIERKQFIKDYLKFFNNKRRKSKFKTLIKTNDSIDILTKKMIQSVVNSSSHQLEYTLYKIFEELDKEKDYKYKRLDSLGLTDKLWEYIKKQYNYKSDNPGIKDFLINLLDNYFYEKVANNKSGVLNQDAVVFINHWMDNAKFKDVFASLSQKIEGELDITTRYDLHRFDYEELINVDCHKKIDKIIIADLAQRIANKTIAPEKVKEVRDERRAMFWYQEFEPEYQCLFYGNKIINSVLSLSYSFEYISDCAKKYVNKYHRIDFYYRKFIYFYNRANYPKPLNSLSDDVEKIYVNKYLLNLNNNVQKIIDKKKDWKFPLNSQFKFYKNKIRKYIRKQTRIFIIISDGLRYEVGFELNKLINGKDRYTSEIDYMIGVLPSYTQLGMAALLPHNKLEVDKHGKIIIDGKNSNGVRNRREILNNKYKKATAIKSEELLNLSRDEGRDFTKKYEVIYVYQNTIDARGDDTGTESEIFGACEDTFKELDKIIRRINSFNCHNILITSDHGFLYQNSELEESDLCKVDKSGDIYYSNKRFILGKNLSKNERLKKFDCRDLKIDTDAEVLIAKSVNRIRVQGGGRRFVHGGASLQEIVIPVLEINKKRESNIKKVDVEIIKEISEITTSEITIRFDQSKPISETIKPREIKAGFYSKDGELLSNEEKLIFDRKSTDKRETEQKQKFIFKQNARNYKNETVKLLLKEKIEDTNEYKDYKKDLYTMRITFISDF